MATRALPDADARRRIEHDLDTNLLVEAAAGTGKTTSLVKRMVALVASGAKISSIIAVTFTRKAAADLRARFQVALESAARQAMGAQREQFRSAIEHIEQCYIGTIHAFCARLLRERPVEAGINVAFEELDEDADRRLRDTIWRDFTAELFARGDPLIGRLERFGIRITNLRDAFHAYSSYPDVDRWPCEVPLGRTVDELQQTIVARLKQYQLDIQAVLPVLPADSGNDKLMPTINSLSRQFSILRWNVPAELMQIVSYFRRMERGDIVQKNWPGAKAGGMGVRELDRWNEVCTDLEPLIREWQELAYPVALDVLNAICERYTTRRRELGCLNFQDLLLTAAKLLRTQPDVRRYFQSAIKHVLVDEFQDTDPIQAEVLLLLTADDNAQPDWRKCRPRPGSLFVVGDPKQSIYRFRRADIVIYGQVRTIIEASGGKVLYLQANFRSLEPLTNWVNQAFTPSFPATPTAYAPAYVPLLATRAAISGAMAGLHMLEIPAPFCKRSDQTAAFEAEFIAHYIRSAIDQQKTVMRADGHVAPIQPGDFLIITRYKPRLSVYAQALQRYRIPSEVTGSTTLNEIPQLHLLSLCMAAIAQPDDPVALVAVLRSEIFGVSDDTLYRFRHAGGRFNFRSPLPDTLDQEDRTHWEALYSRLQKYALWFTQLPPIAVFERVAADLGLMAAAAAIPDNGMGAGSLAKALELVRSKQSETFSPIQLIEYLEQLASRTEIHDGMSVRPFDGAAVRIMNLHQAKGLESPVVFLADACGESDHLPNLHVNRSGTNVLGYMALNGPTENYQRSRLALPVSWSTYEAEELKFQQAEEQRLLYVASTRAEAQLIVSKRTGQPDRNPWNYLVSSLQNVPMLTAPDGLLQNALPSESVSLTDIQKSATERHGRWATSLERTYDTQTVTSLVKHTSPSLPGGDPFGPEGREADWGTVIHLLLQTAMLQPQADFQKLALSALSEVGLESKWAAEAVSVVNSVRGAAFWKRAQNASVRLTEVPFQKLLAPVNGTVPTIVSGVIDLAFREERGWAVVDYKTGIVAATERDPCVERYRKQVDFYATTLSEILGEPVTEKALFMIPLNDYTVV